LAGLILGYIAIVLGVICWIWWASFAGKIVTLGTDMVEAQKVHAAMVQMVSEGASKNDKSLGWPADAGITTVTELKKRLTDNGFLTTEDAQSIDFQKFEFGNVSEADPGDTIFIKFRTEIVPGATMHLAKDGEEGGAAKGDTASVPPRTPPYLAP